MNCVYSRVLLPFLLFCVVINSLSGQISLFSSDEVANYDLVVLGQIVRQESNWTENREFMYTNSIVEVIEVIHGRERDTIQILTLGGVTNSDFQIVPHAFRPTNGSVGYFFLDRYDDTHYNIVNGLNENHAIYTIKSSENFIDTRFPLQSLMSVRQMQSSEKILEISFNNIHLDSHGYLVFDILFRTNEAGSGVKLSSSEIFAKYSTAYFGEYIDYNEKIAVEKGVVLSSEFIGLDKQDYNQETFKIDITSPCTSAFTTINDGLPLSTFFQQVLTVRILPSDYNQIGQISIDDFETSGSIWYKDPLTNLCNAFDGIIFPPAISTQNLCSITSFSANLNPNNPTQISGGTDEVLTINGTNFGQLPGDVSFPNADQIGGQPSTTDPVDFLIPGVTSWGMSQIQVKVPSAPITVGSGIFEVNTTAGMTCSSGLPLDVIYSLINTRNTTTNRAMKIYSSDSPDDGDGQFVFSIDNLIQNNADALDAVKTAICDWNSSTQVNWRNSLNSIPNAGGSQDNINTIFFALPGLFTSGPNPNPAANARTFISGNRVTSCIEFSNPSEGFLHTTDIDIAIRENLSTMVPPVSGGWNFNRAINPTSNQLDFYSILLHELGHVHLLEHTIPTTDIMFNGLQAGTTLRNISSGDSQGGQHLINISNSVLTSGTNNCPTPISTSSTCQVTSIENFSYENSQVRIFPNPTSGVIDIDFQNLPTYDDIRIEVFDLSGRIVEEFSHFQLFSNQDKIRVTLDTNKFSKSMYIIKIYANGKTHVNKFIYHE